MAENLKIGSLLRKSTTELKIPSVNQINAQIKLLEIWKSQHSKNYPIKWKKRNEAIQDRGTRASKDNLLNETFGCKILNSTFINDSARIWNLVPESIKASSTISLAKKNIKK